MGFPNFGLFDNKKEKEEKEVPALLKDIRKLFEIILDRNNEIRIRRALIKAKFVDYDIAKEDSIREKYRIEHNKREIDLDPDNLKLQILALEKEIAEQGLPLIRKLQTAQKSGMNVTIDVNGKYRPINIDDEIKGAKSRLKDYVDGLRKRRDGLISALESDSGSNIIRESGPSMNANTQSSGKEVENLDKEIAKFELLINE